MAELLFPGDDEARLLMMMFSFSDFREERDRYSIFLPEIVFLYT